MPDYTLAQVPGPLVEFNNTTGLTPPLQVGDSPWSDDSDATWGKCAFLTRSPLAVGAVVADDPTGHPNPGSVTGSSPQWNDNDDATYATGHGTFTLLAGYSTILYAPVSGSAEGSSSFNVRVRLMFDAGNVSAFGFERTAFVALYGEEPDADGSTSAIAATQVEAVDLGAIEDLETTMGLGDLNPGFTWADVLTALDNGDLYVTVGISSPFAVDGSVNTVTVYEVELEAVVSGVLYLATVFEPIEITDSTLVSLAIRGSWECPSLADLEGLAFNVTVFFIDMTQPYDLTYGWLVGYTTVAVTVEEPLDGIQDMTATINPASMLSFTGTPVADLQARLAAGELGISFEPLVQNAFLATMDSIITIYELQVVLTGNGPVLVIDGQLEGTRVRFV